MTVEVECRCKDCKWYVLNYGRVPFTHIAVNVCTLNNNTITRPDDFCDGARRREDNEVIS